jgi:hypothetical protein
MRTTASAGSRLRHEDDGGLLPGAILTGCVRAGVHPPDRNRDRAAHPTRVLVNARPEPFRILLLVLTAAAVALSAGEQAALAATLALNTAGWCAYRLARRRLSLNGWRFGLLPLKYPGFVTVMALSLGDVIPARLAVAAATTYVCASGYELLHDSPARVGGAS